VLTKQVSLFELIKREKDFKKNRMLKSGMLRKNDGTMSKRKKNWREMGDKNKFGSKHKRGKRRKNKFDLNLNFDFLDGRMEGVETPNIAGLLNNMSRLVSKSNIELEILNNADDLMHFSFMKIQKLNDEMSQSLYHQENFGKIGKKDLFGESSQDDKENMSLSNIQAKQVKLKTDRPFMSSKRKYPLDRKRYIRSSLMKKNTSTKPFIITKGQNFSQKYSKLRDLNDEGRSINSSFLSPERKKESRKIIFYDSKFIIKI
jgi:hypothetical protein